jgi:hypothetical protein
LALYAGGWDAFLGEFVRMNFMSTAWVFRALKDGVEVGRVKVFDVKDKERSAKRYFKRKKISFDTIEFFKDSN